MHRLTVHTAIAAVLLAAAPAVAQEQGCAPAAFDTDANGDGMISEAEALSAAEREFTRFDMDKDQNISREEFDQCFAAMFDGQGLMPPGEFGKPADWDKNPDDGKAAEAGSTDSDETSATAASSGDDATGEEQTAESAKPARDEESFAATDLNRDGSIDAAEFGAGAQQVLGSPGIGPDSERDENVAVQAGQGTGEPDEVVAGQDDASTGSQAAAASGDDAAGQDAGEPGARAPQIVQQRFLHSPYADMPTVAGDPTMIEHVALRTAMLFRALDVNGDRSLAKSEWMQAAPAVRHDAATLQGLFEGLDKDGSGGISVEEYAGALASAHAEAAAAARDQRLAQEGGTEDAQSDEQVSTSRDQAGDDGVPVFIYRLYRF